MFNKVKNQRVAPGASMNEAVSCEPENDKDKLPPSRFGATRIVLEPDPYKSVITIIEVTKENGIPSDYLVSINSDIRGSADYYAELVTLLRTTKEGSKIAIRIGSPGGSLYTGAMIASAIKDSKSHVTTIATGLVASAGALIWSAGHTKIVNDGSAIMFHMSSHFDWGNSQRIKISAENTVRYVKEVAIDPLVEEGLLTLDESETIIDKRRDLWLDSATMQSRLEKIHGRQAA